MAFQRAIFTSFQGSIKRSDSMLSGSKKVLSTRYCSNHVNPAIKTWKLLTKQVPAALGVGETEYVYPEHADVVIIGGGFIGASAAYWLKSRAVHGIEVVVLDKDTMYKDVQQNLSLGTLTQHFSLPENIQLSQYSAEFFRNVKEHLASDVDLQYMPTGSIVLASEKYANKLEYNATLQKEQGSRLELLQAEDIKQRYPWLNTTDVKLGCVGYESEGIFNSWSLLKGYLQKSIELGANYVNAEVTGFEFKHLRDLLMEGVTPGTFQKINKVIYKTPDGQERSIKFAACIVAAGNESAKVAEFARVDKASELGLHAPHVIDTSGLWLRRNGLENNLLFGMVPLSDDSKDMPEEDYYNNIILPSIKNRLLSCNTENDIW
ncbi:FAD oxidoreductase [Operophtera brumata]|uniref:FAD-dependent oxidoreductase domain-containing protein 1 n=1 Tax=Operophtera brumata TaxID=104452 RepID=A0A0L7KY90_OPEBR|nr:FAD oxidoreductase [Operophtera brumata]